MYATMLIESQLNKLCSLSTHTRVLDYTFIDKVYLFNVASSGYILPMYLSFISQYLENITLNKTYFFIHKNKSKYQGIEL